MPHILLTCVFSTFAMTGLIWLIQIVHYPLFEQVGEEQFAEYERAHSQRITPIVLPLMLAELVTSAWLVMRPLPEIQTRGLQPWLIGGLILVGLVWASTVLLQVPMHAILEKGFDRNAWRSLVHGNWIRTILWTVRSMILSWVLLQLK